MMFYRIAILFFGSFGCIASSAYSSHQEPELCRKVRFSQPGWTDIMATTSVTAYILRSLGYETEEHFLSVPVTFSALSAGDIDVFLGYWRPSMLHDFESYEKDGAVEIVGFNLMGAKYTLAVPRYVYDEGLRSFNDIASFSERLGYILHGIEPGNDGNRVILSMIEQGAYSLEKFRLIESSEQAMLSEVEARISEHQPIVFLGWEPHLMNIRFKIAYLTGGEGFFGDDDGSATVSTIVRKGYLRECSNVGHFLINLQFSLEMENEIMEKLLDNDKETQEVVQDWLRKEPSFLETSLKDVKTWDGRNAFDAVSSSLKN